MDFWDCQFKDGDEIGEAWSDFKLQIVRAAFETLLLPKATEWLKDELRQTSEDNICQRCQDELERVRCGFLSYAEPPIDSFPTSLAGGYATLWLQERELCERSSDQLWKRRERCCHGSIP
jgi:hypothetical protein